MNVVRIALFLLGFSQISLGSEVTPSVEEPTIPEWQLSVEPIGLLPLQAIGIAGGYRFSERMSIEVSGRQAAGPPRLDAHNKDHAVTIKKELLYELVFKSKVWANFFVGFGAGHMQRTIKVDHGCLAAPNSQKYCYYRNSEGVEEQVAFSDIGLIGAIGSRWDWKSGFFLGADWIKVYHPIAFIYRPTVGSQPGDDVNLATNAQNEIDKIQHEESGSVARLHLGWAF